MVSLISISKIISLSNKLNIKKIKFHASNIDDKYNCKNQSKFPKITYVLKIIKNFIKKLKIF